MPSPSSTSVLAILLAFVLAGCGGNEGNAAREVGDSADTPAQRVFTQDDLVAFERGFRKEIDAVREAQQAVATAPDAQARGRALQAQWETATVPQGAAAAGLDEARYRDVRTAVHEVLRTLDFQGKIDGPLSMDLSRADEETRAKLAGDAFAELPAESAAALRARLDRLAPLWAEYMTLTAVSG